MFTVGFMGFPGSSAGKESACNAGDPGLIPGLGRSPAEGLGYPLQYSWASLVAQLVFHSMVVATTDWHIESLIGPSFSVWLKTKQTPKPNKQTQPEFEVLFSKYFLLFFPEFNHLTLYPHHLLSGCCNGLLTIVASAPFKILSSPYNQRSDIIIL